MLGVFMALYGAYFARWLVVRHQRFATYDYDLGIFDQNVWLLSRGQVFGEGAFISVRGLHIWGHHVEPALALFVPFYWLGAGPNLLNIAMVFALTLSAIPAFKLARPVVRNEWAAVVVAVAVVAHFSSQWLLQETFHPEVMAIAPLLWGYLAATEARWRACAAWLVFAVAWKEDVALAVAMMGIVTAIRGNRGAGLVMLVAGSGWFVFCTEVILPAYRPGGPFYGQLYGDLGESPSAIALTSVTDPGRVADRLIENGTVGDAGELLLPFGLLPLASPLALLIGLPQFLASHLTITQYSLGVRNHYVALPLVGAAIATVDGLAALPSRFRQLGVAAIAATTLTTSLAWGVTTLSPDHETALWWQFEQPNQEVWDAAVEIVPNDAAVAATYSFVPQLTHRSEIHRFPNPWRSTNWAADDDRTASPDVIDWLVLETLHFQPGDQADLDRLLDSGEWSIEFAQNTVIVARRSSA